MGFNFSLFVMAPELLGDATHPILRKTVGGCRSALRWLLRSLSAVELPHF